MPKVGKDGGLVADETNTLTADQRELIVDEAFDAETGSLCSGHAVDFTKKAPREQG
jgi:hypothetical protein